MNNEEYKYEEISIQEAMGLASQRVPVYRRWKGSKEIHKMFDFRFYTEDSYFKAVRKQRFYISNREALELFFDRKSFYCEYVVTGGVTKITLGLDTSVLPTCFCTTNQAYFVYN